MTTEFTKYIDKNGKFDFKGAPQSIFVEAFKKMELFRSSKELSNNTIISYQKDLDDILKFSAEQQIRLNEINVFTLTDYQAFINKKYAARSALRKLNILNRLVKFGYKTNYFAISMAEWIEKPKIPKYHYSKKSGEKRKEIRELDLETAKILINALEEIVVTKNKYRDILKLRNKLIGLFLLTTGLRAREVVGLLWNDVFKVRGRLCIEFAGKGNKERRIPLSPETSEYLLEYRRMLGYTNDYSDDSRPIFISFSRNINQQMNYDGLYKAVKAAVNKVAANGNISPHWFRHTFITLLLEQDVPLAIVKELAGHSDISTTNLYLERMNEKTVESEFDKVDFGL